MAEPWEDLPDVVDTSAPADSWESLPDVETPNDGFGPLEPLRPVADQFDQMMPGGFESDLVAPTAQRFAPTYVQAPQEVDLSAYPKLKDVVETEKRISGFTRALQSVGQFFADVKEANAAREAFTRNIEDAQASWAAPEAQQQLAAVRAMQDRKGWLDLAMPFSEGLPLDKLAELDVAPGKVRELDNPEAARIRSEGAFAIAAQRNLEAQRQLEVSKVAYEEWESAAFGKENPAATARRIELEAQLPLNLREEGAAGLLADVVAGSESTLQAAGETAKGAGVGGLAAGLGTLAATRNPAAARTAAQLGAKVGGLQGAANFTFRLETGSTFRDSEKWVGSDGKPLSLQERAGAAFLSGALKTGIELVEFSMLAKALGPATKTLTVEGAASLRATIARDPSMRALLVRAAKTWAKTTLPEVAEEGAQELTDQAVESAFTGKSAFNPTKVTEAVGQSFLPAALTFGPLGAVVNFGAELGTLREYRKAGAQVPHLLALAAEPEMQKSPTEFAKLAGEASGGKTALYVQGEALQRFFQERTDDPTEGQRQLEEALGPGAADKVTEAVATGGFVEVPLAAVPRWAAHEAAAALTDDTTTHPEAPTPRELRKGGAALEEAAKAQADAFLAQAADGQAFDAKVKEWEAQQVEAGQSKRDAKVGALVLRHLVATAAKDSGKSPLEVLGGSDFAFAAGDEQAAGQGERLNQSPVETLAQRAESATPEQRATELFTDPVSGLRTRKAWDESPRQPGTQVAIITSPDMKALNDHPTGGHDTGNELLTLIGGVVGAADAEAARSGTNFLLHVKTQAQLNATLKKIRAVLPKGLEVVGAVAADVDQAFTRLDQMSESMRKEAKLPPRGQTNFKGELGPQTFAHGKRAKPNVSPALLERAAATKGEAFLREAYLDKDVPGVLSKIGFDALPAAAHVIAFDLKGLKKVNEAFPDKKMGDQVLKVFGEIARSVGGEGVAFAHLSGDEYAAKHDNQAELVEFEQRLRAALRDVVLRRTLSNGEQFEISPDFRSGIGEKTYGAADRALNEAKRREASTVDAGTMARDGEGAARVEGGGRDGSAREGQAGLPAGEVERLKQDNAGAAPKGYFEAPEATAAKQVFRIFLNKSADLSTVVHESAHAWLEFYRQLAAAPDATDTVKAKWADIAKWLDAGEGRLTREQHEKFARSFEAYLFEGKAPKKELTRAFNTLKRWLVSLYRTLQGIPGADLNDDARRVFDALLATDDEVQAYQRAQGPQAFSTAEKAGVTDAEWQAQLEAQRDATSEGSQRAARAAVKDALRVHEKWWKDGLKKLRAVFADEYEALPGVRAQRFLKQAKLEVTDDNAGQVAELLGFASVSELRTALAEVPDKAAWVEAHASSEMAAQHPGVLERRDELRALVADGLNAYTEKRLLDERAAFRKHDPKVGAAPVAVLRRAAALIVEKTPLGRLSPGLALSRERAAAGRAQKAAAKGKWAEASKANTEQLLNHYLHAELLQAREVRGQLEAAAKALSKKAARERLGKASPVYRDAVDFLLSSLGLAEPVDEALDAGVLEQALGELEGDGVTIGDPEWVPAVAEALQVGDAKRVTIGQARGVLDALEQFRAAARHRTEDVIDGRRVEEEEVVAGLLEEARTNKRQQPALASSESATTRLQSLRQLPGRITAPLLKIETMVDWLGGVLLGKDPSKSWWYRAVFKPLEGARQREADIMKQRIEPIEKAMAAIPASVRKTWMDPVDGRALFPDHRVGDGVQDLSPPSRRFELVMMALNAGTPSSLERLTLGRNITVDQVRRALDTLTKEEIDWANAVGEAFDGMWPEIAEMEERVTGLKPNALERQAFPLKNGTLEGHYFPAIYDRRVSKQGEHQVADQVAALMDRSFGGHGTQHGHTKARVEGFVGPIALEPSAITVHLAQAVHDLAFREAIMKVGRRLLDSRVIAALKNALGDARWKQFDQWIRDVGTATGMEGAQAAGFFLTMARKVRANTTISALGFSVPNFIEDFTAIPSALFDRDLTGPYIMRGLQAFLAHRGDAIAEVERLSPTMRAANDSLQRDLTRRIDELTASGPLARGPLAFLRHHAFDLIEASFKATATPLWIARYQQAVEAGENHAGAVDLADKMIRRLFPMHSAVNAAGVIRDRGWVGLSLQFFGFFSTANNVVLSNAQEFFESPRAIARAKAAGRTLGYLMAISLLGALARRRGPGEDEPPEEWAMRTMVGTLLAQVPLFGDVANLAESKLRGRPAIARPSTAFGAAASAALEAVVAAISDADTDKKVEAAVRAAGPLFGIPTAQPLRTGRYLRDVAAGETEVADPLDLAGGLIYGPKPK